MTSDQKTSPSSGPQKDPATPAEQLAALADEMRELFAAAVERVGLEEATRLWTQTPNEPRRKRGRPQKLVLSGWDALLLEIYDRLVHDPHPEALPRHIADFIYAKTKGLFQSPHAVERKLRRLLADRKAGKLTRVKREGFGIPATT